jgi:hypothetical protein
MRFTERLRLICLFSVGATDSPKPLGPIAREGIGTYAARLRSFNPERRYSTLVAAVLDTATMLIDEAL